MMEIQRQKLLRRGAFWAFLAAVPMLLGTLMQTAFGQAGGSAEEKPASVVEAAVTQISEALRKPILVLSVASVDRVLDSLDYVFLTADQPQVMDLVGAQLAAVRDLAGLDRKRPLGLMVFIDPSVNLQPLVIGYVPISDINELMQTFSKPPLSIVPSQEQGYYELIGRRNSLAMRLVGNYGFVAENAEQLDRELPDPEKLVSSLASRYEIAVRGDLTSVPEALRDVLAQSIRAGAEARLKPRGNEIPEQFALRKSNVEAILELIEMALEDGEQFTLGLDVSPESHKVLVEADLSVRASSPFSDYLENIAGRRSRFESVLQSDAPLTVSVSWSLSKQGKASFRAFLDLLERRTAAGLDDEATKTALQRLINVLRRTIDQGHVDGFIQMHQPRSKGLVLVGGLKVADSDTVVRSLARIFQYLHDRSKLAELQLNALSYKGVTVHRIQSLRVRKRDEQLYGEKPSVYAGGGNGVVWLAVGGPHAVPVLKSVIDTVQQQRVRIAGAATPFRVIIHARPFVERMTAGRPTQPVALQALTEQNDRLQLEFQPSDKGAHVRAELGEGFVRLLGLAIGRRVEQRFQP